jgi:predicted ATP-grasp superfamily ATP-dependent carboligase
VLKVAESIGVPVPKSVFIEENEDIDIDKLGLVYPIIVKPNSTDGSFGELYCLHCQRFHCPQV